MNPGEYGDPNLRKEFRPLPFGIAVFGVDRVVANIPVREEPVRAFWTPGMSLAA